MRKTEKKNAPRGVFPIGYEEDGSAILTDGSELKGNDVGAERLMMFLCYRFEMMLFAYALNDAMFAPHVPQDTSCASAHIIAEGNIICPKGQTSLKKARESVLFSYAGSRGRTDTVLPPPDFESGTSANSIIPALLS